MKIESAKQKGSETGPLFPPLHANETRIKAGLRAPPHNKMALFEQFTIPFNGHVRSHEVALINPSHMQHGSNECRFTYLSPATLASMATINRDVDTNVKPSYSSSIGSLSTCSTIVNTDESQSVRMQEPAGDESPSLGVTHKQIQRSDEKGLKDKSKDVNDYNGKSLHVVDHSQACGQPIGVKLESFHDCDDSAGGDTFNAKSINITERSQQEATTNCEGLAPAASQLSGPENGESEHNMNTDVLNYAQIDGSNQPKSNGQFVECHPSLGRNTNPPQKPGVLNQDDSPCIVNVADAKTRILSASSCEKMISAIVNPFPASIKPKDVINVVGQQLFWKVRKAILRQQEVFSNQLFELHKLINVQKLLAKMPCPLIDEHMLLGGASDKLGCNRLPNVSVSIEQENLGDRRAQAPVPSRKRGGQVCGSKPRKKFVPCEESEGRGFGAGVLTNASVPLVLMNAPFGYPVGPLNSPFVYRPGSSGLPSGSPFGAAYVVGPNPPMAPFAFPCYSQRSEQTSAVCPNNQWPSAVYHNPFLAPMANDWFTMNYQGQALLASGSDKARPTSSAPSTINMKADTSMHSVQPAVPCVPQQLGSSILIAKRSLGSHATASASMPMNGLSRKRGAGDVGELSQGPSPGSGSGCVACEGWGAYQGERKAETETSGRLRNVEGGQLPTISGLRAGRMDVDNSFGDNALNLFPLQPSSSLLAHSEGRISTQSDSQGHIIKAVPRSALAASESAAGILLSIQRERKL